MTTHIVAGLGNPGAQYERQRHNVGFMAVDRLAARAGVPVTRKRLRSLLGKGVVAGRSAVLLKPQTYMNLSGEALQQAARFYRVDPQDVVVIHDDGDLELGRLMLKRGGGNAGHNGIQSISQSLGTRDYLRVRIGIGRPMGGPSMSAHVLAGFTSDETKGIDEALERACDAVELLLESGEAAAMNRYNRRT